jgi:DNA-binding transcriptional LysR family regulator
MEDLNDLRLVALIAHTGSLSGAAKRLGVNHATVFRRIAQLEDRVGVRLFERSAGRYHPTPAGDELARAGALMDDAATQALLHVAGQDLRPSGTVRISTTDSVALTLLYPVLALCRAQYPQITLTVSVDNDTVNLSKRDADIAVRPTSRPPEHLIGKRITPLHFGVYGAKRYLKTARKVTQLSAHEWIALDDSQSGHRTLRWLESIKPLADVGLRTNSFGAIRQACVDGLGLALLPCFMAHTTPTLQAVGDPVPECATELWLLTHPDLRDTTRVKVVFQLLHAALEKAIQEHAVPAVV